MTSWRNLFAVAFVYICFAKEKKDFATIPTAYSYLKDVDDFVKHTQSVSIRLR